MAGWKGFGASVFSECVVDRLVTNQVCPEKSKPGREKAWKWSLNNVECCPGEEGLLCFVGFQVPWAEAPRGQGSALPREVVATMRQVTSQEKSGVGLEVLPLKFLFKKKKQCAKTDNCKAYQNKFYTKATQSFPAVLGLLLAFFLVV